MHNAFGSVGDSKPEIQDLTLEEVEIAAWKNKNRPHNHKHDSLLNADTSNSSDGNNQIVASNNNDNSNSFKGKTLDSFEYYSSHIFPKKYIAKDYDRESLIAGFVPGVCFGLAALIIFRRVRRPFKLYPTTSDVPGRIIRDKGYLRGVVVANIHGDTLRVRHTPLFRDPLKDSKSFENSTILVKIAGIKTPRLGSSGSKEEPFSAEARAFAGTQVLNSTVGMRVKGRKHERNGASFLEVELIYGYWPLRYNLAHELLKKGLAVVRPSNTLGPVFNIKYKNLERIQEIAKEKHLGIWESHVSETKSV